MSETLKRKIVVGLSTRLEWVHRLESLLRDLAGIINLDLDENDLARLSGLPEALADLIYAGALEAVSLEFGGEVCEIQVIYYPGLEEEDDLDLSVFRAVDWGEVSLRVQARVGDPGYASAVAGARAEEFSSESLSFALVRASREGEEGLPEDGDERPDRGTQDDTEGREL